MAELTHRFFYESLSVAQRLTSCVATVDENPTIARVQEQYCRPPLADLVSSSFLGRLGVSDPCRAEPSTSGPSNKGLPSALAQRDAGWGRHSRSRNADHGGIEAAPLGDVNRGWSPKHATWWSFFPQKLA
ncbi:uncharacterized protein N7473_011247 [Penicillium subrubescens]|uniref:Uncharacterized protein n=1 Tax=Penicillium subrubescens TaxID=1316194 RepID=A0A1Q5U5F0_9EURO|nr:uncharacterized protein N7473_011247 [Penicillium subrubescens]KAJ5880194.1 hypothetical protein N7473_011247 [Penicillium subrubescens]OKP07690.1 hypothetical protein PENSUB_5805 [Penicillium subrubescens]